MTRAAVSAHAREKLQLLGLAFAGADLVFEIDEAGAITFALGAAEQVAGRSCQALVGQPWTALFADSEAPVLRAALETIGPAQRQGPIRLRLPPTPGRRLDRYADLSLLALPQSPPRLSCSLAFGAAGGARRDDRGSIGLEDLAIAAQALLDTPDGGPVGLDLIELKGLDGVLAGLDNATALTLEQRLSALLRVASPGGIGAVQVATGKYALLGGPTLSLGALGQRLAQAAGPKVDPAHARMSLSAGTPEQALKAMRYALDRFIAAGPAVVAQGFEATMDETVREAARFKKALADDAFALVYQPIVDLDSGALHHFEALARFSADASPADTIRMAEELDLIVAFDVAVIDLVARALRAASGPLKVAANISAVSLMAPRVLDHLERLSREGPRLRDGLLIELTETKALADLTRASHALTGLRRLGFAVCLDDFGAGSASLDYLRQFEVDFVKIDGRYVAGLEARPRDGVVLKHVAALCAEMGVSTIAEMVETAEVAQEVRRLGVRLGQGWHFGKPAPTPHWTPLTAPPVARRRGAVEQWG
ncbi:EAL domain-containing protein [soil metagenome]